MTNLNLIRRIDLISLQFFVAVCEEGTLTRAADRENIAASALSKRLVELEAILGASLFVRHPKGMTLTSAGEALLHHARCMLTSVEQMGAELSEFGKGIRGQVRILANVSAIAEFLPDDLLTFLSANRLVKVDLEERRSASIVRAVGDGYGEIGVCVSTAESGDLHTRRYRSDRLTLVVPEGHPLSERPSVEFVESLEFDQVCCHSDSAIYVRSRAAAARAGRAMNLRVNVPSFDAVCRMVQFGLGVGLIPDRAFAEIAFGKGLKAIPLTDEWAYRELKIVTRDPRGMSRAAKKLADHLAQSEEDRCGDVQVNIDEIAPPLSVT